MVAVTPTKTVAEGGTTRHVWAGVNEGDTCDPVSIPGAPDPTVQVIGTPGGATVTIEGSLEETPTTYFPLQDVTGADISLTAVGGEAISTSVVTWIKPVVTDGSGTDITIILLSR